LGAGEWMASVGRGDGGEMVGAFPLCARFGKMCRPSNPHILVEIDLLPITRKSKSDTVYCISVVNSPLEHVIYVMI